MAKTAQDYLNVWRSWLGYSEANGKYRKIIDIYNRVYPLPRDYKLGYEDAWCDATASAAAIQAGMTHLIGRECGCEEHIKIFKNLGIWIEDGTITPKPGYLIVYNWDDASQPNEGYADHIGVVETVNGKYMTCIEGNYKDKVARRQMEVGCGYIRGYAAPRYEEAGSAPEPPLFFPDSSEGELNKTSKWTGIVSVRTTPLNVRTWAGTEYPVCSFSPLENGTEVKVCDALTAADGSRWYYIEYEGKYGFVHAAYVVKSLERVG